jgi:hypothetical protein
LSTTLDPRCLITFLFIRFCPIVPTRCSTPSFFEYSPFNAPDVDDAPILSGGAEKNPTTFRAF